MLRHDIRLQWAIAVLLLIIVGYLHIYNITRIPSGFHKDEAAIGFNAALIASTGCDEYGEACPVYFRSFNDYKAPVYIYTVALIFKILGPSAISLRLTSAFWYFVSLAAILVLLWRVFNKRMSVLLYAILAYGLLPSVFTISRYGVEVISQVGLFTIFLLFVWLVFETPSLENKIWPQIGCGIFCGLSQYAYPTSRLLVPICIAYLWLLYGQKKNLFRLSLLTGSFLTSIVPHVLYTIGHPGAMTARLQKVSCIFDKQLSISYKIDFFIVNYFKYISPDFLIIHGDPNLRHGTGHGGIIYIVVMILFCISVYRMVFRADLRQNSFQSYLLGILIMIPAIASLTSDAPHALRASLMGPVIFLISCYGLNILMDMPHTLLRKFVITSLFIILIMEICVYQYDYFQNYWYRSAKVMGSYGLPERFLQAIDLQKKQIIYVTSDISYSLMEFCMLTLWHPSDVRLIRLESTESLPSNSHSCLLYRSKKIGELFGGDAFTAPANLPLGDELPGSVKLKCR